MDRMDNVRQHLDHLINRGRAMGYGPHDSAMWLVSGGDKQGA